MIVLDSFCGNGTHLSEAWRDHGLTHCFIDTVGSSVLFGFILIFGGAQILVYRKYSTALEAIWRPKSCLYQMQILLCVLMSVESLLHFTLKATVLGDKTVYVHDILSTCFITLAWPLAIAVTCLERKRLLPSIPTRGHGLVLLVFWSLAFILENVAFISWFSRDWWWQNRDKSNTIELGLWIGRYCTTGILFILAFVAPGIPKNYWRDRNAVQDDEEALMGPQDNQRSTWSNVKQKVVLLFPYIWPKKSVFLQACVSFCIVLLVIGRIVNLFTPIYYKYIVDSLTITNQTAEDMITVREDRTIQFNSLQFRWDYILIYISLRFLQGGGAGSSAFLNNLRSLTWIRVQQYTSREIGVRLYRHLHGLSLRWHLGRKTGEVLRVMDRGTTSINSLLNYILFNIAPTIIDIIIAIIYFLTAFGPWFALIVFVTMALYLLVTILITEWRTKYRRDMNKLDNDRNAKGVDSLLNFETVKYYSAEDFEVERYRDAIVSYQKAEFISNASLVLLNFVQNLIINLGFAAGAFLCAWYIVKGKGLTVGDFVLFATYIMQLYVPLNWLGTYYRMIQQAFIDMENMFDLLSEKQEIKDTVDAASLQLSKGMIEFNDVSFHYQPEKPILRNVSFVVPPGQTFALVGPSGAGKSTIIRLLFRFYDVQSGVIRFDGQDISQVKQKTLRQAIGVVPQDTVLFNDNIRYNIRYGRVTANDAEVEEAAKAADIHEKILTFPDAYNTKVGERGLKLSGGEKQRVAIARTILKSPEFVLLDEATSALDTQTERNIQSSLAKVCENRTTIIVAHRLSTIIHADQILVLQDGEVVERGTHDELLSRGEVYANMWQQQLMKGEDSSTEDTDDGGASSDAKQPPNGSKKSPRES